MTKADFTKEHKHLVGVLRSPTSEKLKAEAGKQAKELRKKR
mgnify:CR=1 FL=1